MLAVAAVVSRHGRAFLGDATVRVVGGVGQADVTAYHGPPVSTP
jgi:hypothetical protein